MEHVKSHQYMKAYHQLTRGHTVHTTIIAFTTYKKNSTYKYIPFVLYLECGWCPIEIGEDIYLILVRSTQWFNSQSCFYPHLSIFAKFCVTMRLICWMHLFFLNILLQVFNWRTIGQNTYFSTTYRIYDYLQWKHKSTLGYGCVDVMTLKKWGCEESPSVLAPCPATAAARAGVSQSSRGCW